jgi:MYXO-CTERM domain-containing protein
VSNNSFTPISCDDGLSCTTDSCSGGTCSHTINAGSCEVGGACYASGAPDPANACLTCQPGVSNGSFTPISCDDGLSCTTDSCSGGTCAHTINAGSCSISGACYASGAPSPSDPCFTCQPAVSNTIFTAVSCDDGLGCTTDSCSSGTCLHAINGGTCDIGGACYAGGASDPADPCEVCDPSNPTQWSPNPSCAPDAGPQDSGSDSGGTGEDSGSTGNDSGSAGDDSGSTGNDSGSAGNDSGSTGNDSGTAGDDSGSTGNDSGSAGDDSGSAGNDSGSTGNDSGSAGDDSGSTGNDSGSAGDDSGSTGSDSGSAGDDSGSTGSDSGSAGDDSGSTGNDSGSAGDDSGITGTDASDASDAPFDVQSGAGCGCRVAHDEPSRAPLLAVGALALVAVRRRRRRD